MSMTIEDRLNISIGVENNYEGWEVEAHYIKMISKSINMLPDNIKNKVLDEVIFIIPSSKAVGSFFYIKNPESQKHIPVIYLDRVIMDKVGTYLLCKVILHEIGHYILGSHSEEDINEFVDKYLITEVEKEE